MGWTKKRLEEVVRTRLGDAKLVIVANREPYIHQNRNGVISCLRPASGLTTGLDPVMRACGGVWVAHGSGNADFEVCDEHGRLAVPPESPCYTLHRVWLSPEEEEGYYYGFANGTMWPLCHQAFQRPKFDPTDWEQYVAVNRKFTEAVLNEVDDEPGIIFVQDYHFALLPRMLKASRPDLVVAQFWHIPWPSREVFSICPWGDEILDGLLGNDLLAFHTQYHCNNFLETIDGCLEARVDWEKFGVIRNGLTSLIRPYPISVDPDQAQYFLPENLEAAEDRLRTQFRLNDLPFLVGVDRLDYTKGIPDRIRAVDRLLTLYPEMHGRFHFVQIAAPSRVNLCEYQDLAEETQAIVDEINWKYEEEGWQPIIYCPQHFGPETLYLLYRICSGCIVSPLHDGMNLVAKEFISSRDDEMGVLVLSRFTGAAKELPDSVLVNPYDLDELAEALYRALTMPLQEQQTRMRRLRDQVNDNNIYRWAGMLLSEAGKIITSSRPVELPRFGNLFH